MKALISGTLNKFVYLNYLRNQKEFKTYSSPKMFGENYLVDEATLNASKSVCQTGFYSFKS